MAKDGVRKFTAVLEPLEGGLGWVVARVPFDVAKAWPTMVRRRVRVEIAGEVFRTSLFPDAKRGGHFVLANKAMQKAAGMEIGGRMEMTVAPDLAERSLEVPPELAKIFKGEKKLAKWYAGLSEAVRRELAKWINGVKGAEARARRADQAAERLMLAMEGETMLPPVVEVAFRAAPKAREGWKAMTLNDRRGQLLGVFYYQSPEARARRVGKLVEACLLKVERG